MKKLQAIVNSVNFPVTVDDVYIVALDCFPGELSILSNNVYIEGVKVPPYDLYSKIDDLIIDMKDLYSGDQRKIIDIVDVMTWAIYRVLSESFSSCDDGLFNISTLNKEKCISLFLENMDCEEGAVYKELLG